MPSAMASRDDSATYAASRGMDAAAVRTLSRDQIREEFVPPDAPRVDVPYVERLDQDPESRAAYREGRRKPGERQ